MITKTYEIRDYKLDGLQDQIERLNRRAKRIGCVQIIFTIVDHHDEFLENGRVHGWVKIEISGEAPKYAGWTFIGTIQHLPSDENGPHELIRSIPGEEIPEQYRSRGDFCDHCKVARYRKDTFIVRHEDGTYKQVGRQCLADFLGHENPHTLAAQAEFIMEANDLADLAEEDDFCGGGSGGFPRVSIERFLQQVAGVIRVCGWMSRSKAKDLMKNATCDTAYNAMISKPYDADDQRFRDKIKPNEDDIKLAEEALEWAKGLGTRTDLNDYLYNISTIAGVGIIDYRTIGYAASIIPSYKKEVQKQYELKRAQIESQHFGEIGKRTFFHLILERVIPIDGNYPSWLHIFHDQNGNRAIWFASGYPKIEEGQVIKFKATIKNHDERNGIKQTILTRVTIIEEEVINA